jgi:hypothetical protein
MSLLQNKKMEADPRAPRTLRHPEDTLTTFEHVVKILKDPNTRPFCGVPVILCTGGDKYTTACDTLDFCVEPDKITFGEFEVYPHDLLYMNWFRNRLSFILIVYR